LNLLSAGIIATPGVYGYGIVNEDVEACAQLTSPGAAAMVEVSLDPVVDEQSIAVRAGDLTLGSIHGMDAQVVLRSGGLRSVPARVYIGRPRAAREQEEWAAVTLAIAIDSDSVPREPLGEGGARTPGAYPQHVQGCQRYTATLRTLCADGDGPTRCRATLSATDGGFHVTIAGAAVGTVLSRDATYAATHLPGPVEIDALVVRRQGKRKVYAVHLAVEFKRPTPRP
jgi:hypothetical protein